MTHKPISASATNVVTHFLHTLIDQNLMPSIQELIRSQLLLKQISIKGIRQNTKTFLPKILHQVQAQLDASLKNTTTTPQKAHQIVNLNRNKSVKKTFRKSCDDMMEQCLQVKNQFNTRKPSWLKGFREQKLQIAQLNKNMTCQASNPKNHLQNKRKGQFFKDLTNANTPKHARNSSVLSLPQSKQRKLSHSQSQLIKLQLGAEQQEDEIEKKRKNLIRNKHFSEQFQTITIGDHLQSIVQSKDTNQFGKNLLSKPVISYTTDYDGNIIQCRQLGRSGKQIAKKVTKLTRKNQFNKKYSTVANSPQKIAQSKTKNASIYQRSFAFEDESPLKLMGKIKFMVKEENYIDSPSILAPKTIQFEATDIKESLNAISTAHIIKKKCSQTKFKSTKRLPKKITGNDIMSGVEMAPGVIVQNYMNLENEAQENANLVTKKSIGRSIKNIASQTCIATLKNIL